MHCYQLKQEGWIESSAMKKSFTNKGKTEDEEIQIREGHKELII